MTIGKIQRYDGLCYRATVILVGILLILSQSILVPFSGAQSRERPNSNRTEREVSVPNAEPVENAIRAICAERLRDPQASVPIDEMAIAPPLSLTDPRVVAGKSRAQTLLPVAKRLVPFALMRVAANSGLKPLSLKWIIARVKAVNTIKAEVEERDNASWRPSEPHAIIFGTVFLASLRSDEAMIAVLAHELTHAMDGEDRGLQPVFARIEARSWSMGESVRAAAAVELGCEMVGMEVLRDYISQTSKQGTISRRLARGLHKDCVRTDLGDENHLSPRATMRLLLKIKPELATAIAVQSKGKPPRKPRLTRKSKRKRVAGRAKER